jgi:hypothetical protein
MKNSVLSVSSFRPPGTNGTLVQCAKWAVALPFSFESDTSVWRAALPSASVKVRRSRRPVVGSCTHDETDLEPSMAGVFTFHSQGSAHV